MHAITCGLSAKNNLVWMYFQLQVSGETQY